MLIKLYPENPNEKSVAQIIQFLQHDGVIIYPTDSVYGFGCSLQSPRAIEKLRALTGKEGDDFSIICADLSEIASYGKVDNDTFKLMKRNLPGPFTFILNASTKVPSRFLDRKKSVGVRIPDNAIARTLVQRLGCPLVSSSVKSLSAESEYTTDPSLIHEMYGSRVEVVIDGGYGHDAPSTVVDCTDTEAVIIREGIGELQ